MQHFSINWYRPTTDDTLRRARPGEVLTLSAWTGRSPDSWYHIRVTTEPETRTTWHRHVDLSIFGRNEWLEFQIAFGELVFDHAKGFYPVPNPIWEVYPEGIKAELARPAAVAYRFEEHRPGLIPVACIWWGEPGQDPDEFRREVLATLPVPLTVEERFALRDDAPVRVLVAAEPSRERDELAHHLNTQPGNRIIVGTADTAEEVLAALDGIDVVIVADELPPRTGEKPSSTYCFGFIPDELRPRKVPRVGWAVNVQRSYDHDGANCVSGSRDYVMMHLRAACGRVLNGDPEPGRSVVNHILDALDVPSLRKE